MPYDPRQMQQIGRMGIGMMGQPSAGGAMPPWWEQPQPSRKDQSVDQSDDPSQPPNRPKQPPSLLDMMMNLGRMTRPEYDKAIREPGSYGVPPKDAARASPWAFLGSLGTSGGPR
jgi:hypothetical protein